MKKLAISLTITLFLFTGLIASSNSIAAPESRNIPAPPVPPENDRFGFGASGLTFISINDLPDEIRKKAKFINNEYKTKGYHSVDESEIERYTIKNMSNAFVDTTKIRNRISSNLTPNKVSTLSTLNLNDNVRTVEFGNIKFEGAIPIGPKDGTSITAINRIFSLADSTLVIVSERELNATSGVAVPSEAINADVNGFPAIVNVMKSKSGKTITTLSWFTDTMHYTLYKTGTSNEKNKLLALARSI